MAKPTKTNTTSIVLALGLSLLLTSVAAYFILARPAPPIPIEKSELFPFQDRDTRMWGYLDQDLKIVIPAKFEFADLFINGVGMVEDEGLAGYIDAQGQWAVAPRFVMDPQFSDDIAARPFWGGLAAVRRKTGEKYVWGFIDREGEWAILPRFEGADGFQLIGDFRDGRAWFAQGQRYGYLDTQGEVAIEPRYKAVNDFGEGLAGVLIDDEWGMINTEGKMRIRPDFDGIGTFSQGLCAAKRKEQWGYIDPDGDWVIQPKYAGARPFSEGLAPAHNGVAWGYINPDGQYVIDPQYDDAWPHENGLASVEIDGQRKYIDANGRVAWPKPNRDTRPW